jgi:hypothetical protein
VIDHKAIRLSPVIGKKALISKLPGYNFQPKAFLFALTNQVNLPPSKVKPAIIIPHNVTLVIKSVQDTVLVLSHLVLRVGNGCERVDVDIEEREEDAAEGLELGLGFVLGGLWGESGWENLLFD